MSKDSEVSRREFLRRSASIVVLSGTGFAPRATGGMTTLDARAAARALVARVLPKRHTAFEVEVMPADNGKDVFEIESKDGKVVLRGNSGVGIASALNWYLKHHCQCDMSWCGTQMKLPNELPAIPQKVRRVTPHQYRTFFNYCTFSYVMPWWHWEEWERAIDFVAMNGYNMPLAATGLEGVWYGTLLKFGFTDEETRSCISGPAHLPWQWMPNLEGYQGPLPKNWIESHIQLGRRILDRERELGMTPIQQGFSGHVPSLLKKKFPTASIAQQPSWVGFPGVFQLDPLDPLFEKLGKAFMEEEIRLFGSNHLFAADPFHESEPPRPGNDYLSAVGKRILEVMTKSDPDAKWIMQGWTERQPIVQAVPKDRLLILDIGGNRWNQRDAFWGYDFLNCRYNNFGNRNTLHGDLKGLAANPFAAVVAKQPNCRGMGLMMEGMTQNPVYHNMTNDLIWRSEPVDATAWLHDYARRRYGAESAKANQAWDLLLAGTYGPGTPDTEYSSMVAARPALHVKKSGPNEGFCIPYDPRQLVQAWGLLLADSGQLKDSDAYRFDIVDVGRQVLSNLAQSLHEDVRKAFINKDANALRESAQRFETLLSDVDTLLATRSEYHFGKWVAEARSWGATSEERKYYEKNASTIVTYWGPEDSHIFDYAWREWAGLVGSFYLDRWKMFHKHLADCLAKGVAYDDPGDQVYGRESFRANAFYRRLADWEIAWCAKEKDLPASPSGDEVAIAQHLLAKYRPPLDEAQA